MALVDDYDVVVIGSPTCSTRTATGSWSPRLDANEPVEDVVDIVLYDSFAQPESDHDEIGVLVDNPRARRVVVYTWNFHPDLVAAPVEQGAHGYLSKTLPARELVAALEAVHAGEVSSATRRRGARSAVGLDWPGRGEGLTDRESEILALITQGKSNADVAALTYLSPNTVKSYIRIVYRKIGVAQPHPGRAVGRRARLHPRPPPHRALARRTVALAVEQRQLRRLDQSLQLAEQRRDLRTVGDAVVEGARQRHRRPSDDDIVDDDRPRLQRPHAQDGGLGVVDDGHSLVQPEGAEVRHRERGALQLSRFDGSCARFLDEPRHRRPPTLASTCPARP